MKKRTTRETGRDEGVERGSAPRPAYEPPAIAWEEAFESVSATSCGLIAGQADQCNSRPVV